MTRYTTATKTSVATTKKLGEGGEGAVFDIAGRPDLVAKIYHPHRLNAALAAKVQAMTRNPPEDATRGPLGHVSIAWPIDVLFRGTQFVGYTMPKLKRSDDLYDLLQPQQRAKEHGSLNHRHLYRTARNLAIAMDAIHRKGYVLGDVNFKNALFNDDALITIVDCDSMQVTDANGVVHHCLVGVPEYTPPELQGADFSRIDRTPDNDAFGLAVLIFQLLMQGFHPFAGRPRPGAPDVEQAHIYCIKHNIFPYLDNQPFTPPPAAPSLLCLPSVIQHHFERAFVRNLSNPAPRPTPKEWASVLAMVESRLMPCPNDNTHWYPSDGYCVICEIDYNVGRRVRTGTKPSATIQQQAPLSAQSVSTTSALRPAAVSTPPQVAPQPRPTVKPTPRQAPKPAARPQALSTPNPGAVTPLVSPSPAPPPTPPQPRPTVQPATSTSLPAIGPALLQYLRTHRATAIPVAVIVIALLFAAIAANGSAATPPSSTTDPQSSVPTDVPAADVATEPTALPTVFPTAQSTGPVPVCDHASVVRALWPTLSDDVRAKIALTSFAPEKKSYYPAAISITEDTIQPALDADTPLVERLDPIVAACQTAGSSLQLNNPLFGTGPLPDRLSDIAYTTGVLCAEKSCATNAQKPVSAEYRLVLARRDIFTEKDGYRPIDSSAQLLYNFFDDLTTPKVSSVFLVSDNNSSTRTKLLLPFVQHRFQRLFRNNAIWPDSPANSTKVDVAAGTLIFDAVNGFTNALLTENLTQFSRTITLDRVTWADGTPLRAADFIDTGIPVAGIADITAVNATTIRVTYAPGLPLEWANVLMPIANRSSDPQDVLRDSTNDWVVQQSSAGPLTFSVNHQDSRKSFVLVQEPFGDGFTATVERQEHDIVIIDGVDAARALAALPSNTFTTYNVYLVPTGSVWVLEQ